MGNSCGNCNNSQEEKKEELIPDDVLNSNQQMQSKPEKCPVSEEVKEITKKKVSYKNSQKSDDIFKNDFLQEDKQSYPKEYSHNKIHINPQAKNTDINLNSLQKVFSEAFIPAGGALNKTLMPLPYMEEEKLIESHNPATVYEKFGGAEGMTTYIDKMMEKLLGDPVIGLFFKGTNPSLIAEKFKQYMTFLTGGQQHWIGKSMRETHKRLNITDELFDKFVAFTVQTLKEMKVKMDCLKETVALVNTLREQIVIRDEPVVQKVSQTIFDKLGQMEGINQITECLYNKIESDPDINQFFKKSKLQQQKKRFAYFLAAACEGPIEWVGKTMKEAHRGRGIKDEHFMMIGTYLMMALDQFKVDKETQSKIFEKVYVLKKDIVEPKSLYERIIDIVPLDVLIDKFLEKIQSTHKLKQSFSFIDQRTLLLYFASHIGQGSQNKYEDITFTSDQPISSEDFEYAAFVFRQVLLEHQLDQNTIEEVSKIFENIKSDIIVQVQQVVEEEEEIIKVEEVPIHEEDEDQIQQEQQVLINNTERCPFSFNLQQSMKIQQEQAQDAQEQQHQENTQTFYAIKEEQHLQVQIAPEMQQSEPGKHYNEDQNLQEEEQCQVVIAKSNHSSKHSQKSLDIEIDKDIQLPESPISNRSSPRQKKPQKTFKYILSDLLCDIKEYTSKKDLPAKGSIICQGELQRLMEKQKSQLPRWLILNAKALLIYKDQMHSKSFPYKPLYAIPLPEIKSVISKDVSVVSNQRKSQVVHSIQIELSDKYGFIADSIAQLVSSYLTAKEEGPYTSPMKDRGNKAGQRQNQQQQQHGYEDHTLAFVSSSKKDIYKWHKVLNDLCKPIIEESQAEQMAIIQEIEKAQEDEEERPDDQQQPNNSITYE